MALQYETASPSYLAILQNINSAFTFVFIVEAFLTIFAIGINGYFYYGWNRFDFVVVIISIIDFILTIIGNKLLHFAKIVPQLARIFRIFRVIRIFKLVKQLKGL